MAVNLNWINRVAADEIRVYRSEGPISPDALPSPLATIAATAKAYADETAIAGHGYYYAVGAVKSGNVALSKVAQLSGVSWTDDFRVAGTAPDWVMDYAGQQYYDGASSGLTFTDMHTFSRSAAKLYTASNGLLLQVSTNVPAFNHRRVTAEPIGISIEPARTNYAPYTIETADPAFGWFNNQVSVATNAAADPNGPSNAQKLTVQSPGTDPYSRLTITTTSLTWLFSFFVKGTAGDTVQILSYKQSTGETEYTPPFVLSDGWDRIDQARVFSSPVTSVTFRLEGVGGTGKIYYLYGHQAEKATRVSSLIWRGVADVTRPADSITIDGLAGTYDVRVTYGDDDTTHDFLAESVGATYWPSGLTQYNIKSVAAYPAGTL